MGILVKTVGIFKAWTPRVRLGAVIFCRKYGNFGEKYANFGQKCGSFGGEHPGICWEKLFLGENVGILVKTVGIFKGCTPRIRLGAVIFCGKYGNFGGKRMEFGSKMWDSGGEHPGIHGVEFFWGEKVGILVKTVGILMKMLGFSKL